MLNVDTEKNQPIIENEVLYDTKHMSFSFLKSAVSSSEVRQQLLNDGIEASKLFLSLKQKKECENEEKNNEKTITIVQSDRSSESPDDLNS